MYHLEPLLEQEVFTQTSLILRRAVLRPGVCRSFLRCFSNLKHFSCEFIRDDDTYEDDNHTDEDDGDALSARAVIEGLSNLFKCLEELRSTITKYEGVLGDEEIQRIWRVESLIRFENLR